MGMYTHLVLNVSFKRNTPKEVIDTIRYMVGDIDDAPLKGTHELFETDRWSYCLRCDSAYFMGLTNTTFGCNALGEWELTVNSNCKNYCSEYAKFLDYIRPYILYNEFLGFIRYEEDDHPTLIYSTDKGIEYISTCSDLAGDLW